MKNLGIFLFVVLMLSLFACDSDDISGASHDSKEISSSSKKNASSSSKKVSSSSKKSAKSSSSEAYAKTDKEIIKELGSCQKSEYRVEKDEYGRSWTCIYGEWDFGVWLFEDESFLADSSNYVDEDEEFKKKYLGLCDKGIYRFVSVEGEIWCCNRGTWNKENEEFDSYGWVGKFADYSSLTAEELSDFLGVCEDYVERKIIDDYVGLWTCSYGEWIDQEGNVFSLSSSSAKTVSSSGSLESESSSSLSLVDEDCSNFDGKKHTLMDCRDSVVYKTVRIGGHEWMAENLKYNYVLRDSDTVVSASFCYDDDEENCERYGRLYTWASAMDSALIYNKSGKTCGFRSLCQAKGFVRGVCPAGWHLPILSEFEELISAVGGESLGGQALKSNTGWLKGDGTDEIGFTALPAGMKISTGYENLTIATYFWSSYDETANNATALYLNMDNDKVFLFDAWSKTMAASVRCVKDFLFEFEVKE